MRLYGRSRGIGFHGVVLNEKDKIVRECNHLHLSRSSAEKCGKILAMSERKRLREQNQAS